MYVDRHEHEDVVDYRTQVFLPFWSSIEDRMMKWMKDNDPIYPQGMPSFPQQSTLFWLHTMNRHFMQMTGAKLAGFM
jgi:hypothetical protein